MLYACLFCVLHYEVLTLWCKEMYTFVSSMWILAFKKFSFSSQILLLVSFLLSLILVSQTLLSYCLLLAAVTLPFNFLATLYHFILELNCILWAYLKILFQWVKSTCIYWSNWYLGPILCYNCVDFVITVSNLCFFFAVLLYSFHI